MLCVEDLIRIELFVESRRASDIDLVHAIDHIETILSRWCGQSEEGYGHASLHVSRKKIGERREQL
jgi:hypothetical protein